MTTHPLERASLGELEQRMEQVCADLEPGIFLDGGEARYNLIHEVLQTYPGGGLIGNIHRALLTGQARSLRTVQLLTMRGYPQDAAAVARTALERAFQQGFIGKDQERAEQWVHHTDEKQNFAPHFNCVNSTIRRWFAGETEAELLSRVQMEMQLYKQISAHAHGNPVVTKGLDLRLFEGRHSWMPMPNFTVESFVRCGRLMLATHRCAEVALLAAVFARVTPGDEGDKWTRRLGVLCSAREAAGQRLDLLEEAGKYQEAVTHELQRVLHAND